MSAITSRQNPLVKRFRDARATRARVDAARRRTPRRRGAGLSLPSSSMAVVRRRPLRTNAWRRLRPDRARGDHDAVTDPVLAAMSPVRHPSGVVAIARRRPADARRGAREAPPLVLMLDEVQDPGQRRRHRPRRRGLRRDRGRRADGTADPFGWKALRGAMGSAFRLPVACRQSLDGGHRARATSAGVRVFATVPRDGTPLPRCDLRGRRDPARRRRRRAAADLVDAADEPLTIPDAAAGRVAERRGRRGADRSTKRIAPARARPPVTTIALRRRRRRQPGTAAAAAAAARRAHAAADARRVRRPGGAPRPGPAAAPGDRAGPPAVDHPLGPARHRQDDARAADRGVDARALHPVQRGALRHQGDPRGDGRSGGGAAPARPPHDPLHRRDPPLQQGAAGRLPPARRGRRHRPDRRDDREPVVRGELGAPLAVEGLRAEAARRRADRRRSCGARSTMRSAGSARSRLRADDEALAGSRATRTATRASR